MAAAEAAADRPWSNDSKGSSCVMKDERMERGAPMSAAAVEGTDADDAKSKGWNPSSSAMDGRREIRTPWSSVTDGTEERRVFTTRGCGFDSYTQSLCISLLYTYA